MRSFKKGLKLLGLSVLIILASFGVGIGGGVPVNTFKRKEDTIEVKMESAEQDQESPDHDVPEKK